MYTNPSLFKGVSTVPRLRFFEAGVPGFRSKGIRTMDGESFLTRVKLSTPKRRSVAARVKTVDLMMKDQEGLKGCQQKTNTADGKKCHRTTKNKSKRKTDMSLRSHMPPEILDRHGPRTSPDCELFSTSTSRPRCIQSKIMPRRQSI